MYGLYQIEEINNQPYLRKKLEVSLFGCNIGLIPKHLRSIMSKDSSAPYRWELKLQEIYRERGEAIIIDIIPGSEKKILMGELTHVFGYSYPGVDDPWTPILLRLQLIADYNSPSKISEFDKSLIQYPQSHDVVYTMLHLKGSVNMGEVVGTWKPGYGSMNSVLLWGDCLSYFFQSIRETDPDFLV